MKSPMKRAAIGTVAAASLIMAPMSAWAAEEGTPTVDATAVATGEKAKREAEAKALLEKEAKATEEARVKAGEQNAKDKANGIVTLNLFNLTDIHGHIEPQENVKDKKFLGYSESGLASVKCYIDKEKELNPNTQFTLLGDNIGASPFTSGIAQDNPTIKALNAMDVFASTIGNHEFDKGIDVLKQRFTGSKDYEKVGFPYLGANVKGLEGLGDYRIWTSESGVRVAFIGAIEDDAVTKVPVGTLDSLTFEKPAPVINSIAAKLKDGNEENGEADIVVAMYDNDVVQSFPRMSKDVDVIMGGDTHVPYFGYDATPQQDADGKTPEMAKGADGQPITATASGSFTDNLSKVIVKYDSKTKKVVSSWAEKISATRVFACGQDATVKKIVDEAAAKADEEKKVVVAKGTGTFLRGIHTVKASEKAAPGSNRGVESTIGGLIADAMKETITTLDKKPVDIGIINAGGIRADLKPKDGVVTVGDVFNFMPFSNEVGYATLTGAQVKTLLEQQWKAVGEKSTRPMLKLGLSKNVTYTYDASRKLGDRITSVIVNGEPLAMNKRYIVGSVTFLMTGGDSFDVLKEDSVKSTYHVVTGLDRDFMAKYLKNNPKVQPRANTSSIGVSISGAKFNEGKVSADIALRGLSFTNESEAQTKNVTLQLGESTVTGAVENSVLDQFASTKDPAEADKAIVAADGAGYTQPLAISADAQCADKAATVHVPLIVKNEAGTELVSAKQGIGVNVNCATGEVTASNGFGDKAAGNQKPDDPANGGNSKGNSSTGESSKGDSSKKSAPKGKLAQTGATVGILAGIAVLTLLGGLVLVRRRQK